MASHATKITAESFDGLVGAASRGASILHAALGSHTHVDSSGGISMPRTGETGQTLAGQDKPNKGEGEQGEGKKPFVRGHNWTRKNSKGERQKKDDKNKKDNSGGISEEDKKAMAAARDRAMREINSKELEAAEKALDKKGFGKTFEDLTQGPEVIGRRQRVILSDKQREELARYLIDVAHELNLNPDHDPLPNNDFVRSKSLFNSGQGIPSWMNKLGYARGGATPTYRNKEAKQNVIDLANKVNDVLRKTAPDDDDLINLLRQEMEKHTPKDEPAKPKKPAPKQPKMGAPKKGERDVRGGDGDFNPGYNWSHPAKTGTPNPTAKT